MVAEDVAGIFFGPTSTVTDCDYVTQSANAIAAGAVGMVVVVADNEYVPFGDVEPNVVPLVGVSAGDIASVEALFDAAEVVSADLFKRCVEDPRLTTASRTSGAMVFRTASWEMRRVW